MSVLMSVYNGERYVEAAIRSIQQQTFEDFELLIVDDGSNDKSLSILQSLQASDHRIIIRTRGNRGLVASLNELVGMARGRYLARMDADDISLPRRFEEQVAFLDQNPGVAVVGTAFMMIDSRGRRIGSINCPCDPASVEQALLSGDCVLSHPSVMIRAEAMIQAGGYRHEFPCAQDLDLWLRISEFAQLANLPEVLLEYRLHSDSISEASGELQRECQIRATSEAWGRRGIEGKFKSEAHWRPDQSHSSRLEFALRYGWIAWSSGFRSTWLSFTLKALRLAPYSVRVWKLAFFGLVKRPTSWGKN